MATNQNLKRLCIFARNGNSFTRGFLKDNFGFFDADFSVLKKRGLLLETVRKVYSVPEDLIIRACREEWEKNLYVSILQKDFEEALKVLSELFNLKDLAHQFQYNYILFLISQIIELPEPWKTIAFTLSNEDIEPAKEDALNKVRDCAYRGEFLEATSILNRLSRKGECCGPCDEISKILLDLCLKRQIFENRILLEYLANDDYNSIKIFLDRATMRRKLSQQEETIVLYTKILLASKKFRVVPRELSVEVTSEEEMQLAGKFTSILNNRRSEQKFKKRIKNFNLDDILLIRIKREQDSSSYRECKRTMCVEHICFLYDVVNALENKDEALYQKVLEEFFEGDENQVQRFKEVLGEAFQKEDYTELCRLFDEIYLKSFNEENKGGFTV